jgi:excisionase family DNA binding protein
MPVQNAKDLTVDQFAELTNSTPRSVRRRISEGKIPTYKYGDEHRIRAEVAAAITAGKPIPIAIVKRDARINAIVAKAPPLSPEQITTLSALFDWPPAERREASSIA